MRIVFVLPVAGQPRFLKRIRCLMAQGCEPVVLSFERDYFEGGVGLEYTSLGSIAHGNYAARLPVYARALRAVRQAAAEADAVYCFGPDLALLSLVAVRSLPNRPKIACEVGDIRELAVSRTPQGKVFRALDRRLAQKVDALVVTSSSYLERYYVETLGLRPQSNWLVLENKLESAVQRAAPRNATSIRIGYFGLIRCQRSLRAIRSIANNGRGRIEVVIRGHPFGVSLSDFVEGAGGLVRYEGPYRHSELREIYGAVDFVWGAYFGEGRGKEAWRWSRSNRFYEACAFGKPLITQVGTADAELVERYGIGVGIDLRDPEGASACVVQSLADRGLIDRISRNAREVPECVYRYRDFEHARLIELLS